MPSDPVRPNLEALANARAARKDAQKANTKRLPYGALVYPDSPPGVGWVLDRRGYPKRYYASLDIALAAFPLLPPPKARP
jgi:hypothetical protein